MQKLRCHEVVLLATSMHTHGNAYGLGGAGKSLSGVAYLNDFFF